MKASAVTITGEALDKLLYEVAPEQQSRIVATADSTTDLGPGLDARNLTDGNLTTAWIAGDKPTIHLSWPDKQPVSSLVLAPAGGLSTRPTKIEIRSPDGDAVVGVDENGWARFDPITTNHLDITVTETAPLTLHNPVANADLQLPVGLTEVYLPALAQYRSPQPPETQRFSLPCGKGPTLAVDGKLYETSAKGAVRDLLERRQVDLALCQEGAENAALDLGSGSHRVEAGDAGPLAVTDVTLTRGSVTLAAGAGRELRIVDWLGDRREVTVGSGAASYLTTYENYNDGWKATLNGKELTPVRLDGWQQGWQIPSGAGGTVKLSYEPSTTYEAGLIGGGVGVAALAGLVLWRRREANPDAPQPVAPGAGPWLGTVALTVVGVVIAGPFALLVPALALLAWKRHALLVPIAFLALAGAGIAAAVGAGSAPGTGDGAFGPAAQLLALIGLFAGLVSVQEPSGQAQGVGNPGTSGPGTSSPGTSGTPFPLGVPAASQAPTAPLPRRQRGENGGPGALEEKSGAEAEPTGEKPGPETTALGAAPATGAEPTAQAPEPDRVRVSGPTLSARGPGSTTRGPADDDTERGEPL